MENFLIMTMTAAMTQTTQHLPPLLSTKSAQVMTSAAPTLTNAWRGRATVRMTTTVLQDLSVVRTTAEETALMKKMIAAMILMLHNFQQQLLLTRLLIQKPPLFECVCDLAPFVGKTLLSL